VKRFLLKIRGEEMEAACEGRLIVELERPESAVLAPVIDVDVAVLHHHGLATVLSDDVEDLVKRLRLVAFDVLGGNRGPVVVAPGPMDPECLVRMDPGTQSGNNLGHWAAVTSADSTETLAGLDLTPGLDHRSLGGAIFALYGLVEVTQSSIEVRGELREPLA
jgi:hypothetical protein